MAAVVSMTMQEEESASQKTVEYVTQLECENRHLRELLHFTQTGLLESEQHDSPSTSAFSFPKNPPPQRTAPRPEFSTGPFGGGPTGEGCVATPMNSGQTTPVVGGEGTATQPLLEQACNKLT